MKKRYVLKNKIRFYTFLFTIFFITVTIFFTSSVHGYKDQSYNTITIREGDTLWSIANTYNKNGDIRKFIYEIKTLNKLTNSEIFVGDEIKIPQ